MTIQPYLFFNGRCDEAIAFYQKAIGAKLEMLMRFKEAPEQDKMPPGIGDKVMHASLHIGDSVVMASDGWTQSDLNFQGFSLSLVARDAAEANRLFKALSDGGQVHMPLGKTFFSPCFGMAADRFGVSWMVIVEPKR
jgi:PhnB protein